MIHPAAAERVALLTEYFVGPERQWLAECRRRSRSRKIQAQRAATSGARHVNTNSRIADFTDPESRRVLAAIADALVAPLAVQQAREDHVRWVASRGVND